MARVIFGTDLPEQGERDVHAVTLDELVAALEEEIGWMAERELRWFVNGTNAARLEGGTTPVGDEDTVLVTLSPSER